jgi:hypothetical protein
MKRRTGVVGGLALSFALGLGLASAGPAQAADTETVYVPGGFVAELSDTRATGRYEVQGTGLHIWTTGKTGTDKVAEYIATTRTPLTGVGEVALTYRDTDPASGLGDPGYQLVVDLDGDGDNDGILVGEPVPYGGNWWLGDHKAFTASEELRALAPKEGGGGGPQNGTLQQWHTAFPDAVVTAFGFSLGSGVHGDGVLESITFAGTRHTFAVPVVLEAKDDCKNGGWADSTHPTYRNQGECVSSFATSTNKGQAGGAATTGPTTGTKTSSAPTATVTVAQPATAVIGATRTPVVLKKMV